MKCIAFMFKGYTAWFLRFKERCASFVGFHAIGRRPIDWIPAQVTVSKSHRNSSNMLNWLSYCIYTFLYFHKIDVITEIIHAMYANNLPLYQHLGILVTQYGRVVWYLFYLWIEIAYRSLEIVLMLIISPHFL